MIMSSHLAAKKRQQWEQCLEQFDLWTWWLIPRRLDLLTFGVIVECWPTPHPTCGQRAGYT